MAELLVGGALGLLVAVVSQWVATGGRLKRLRATIREELELAELMKLPDDSLRTRLKLQARLHLIEYLDDPELNQVVRSFRTKIFAVLWASLSVITGVALSVFGPYQESDFLSFALAFMSGILNAVVVMAPSHWIATHWVRQRFRTGVQTRAQEDLRRHLESEAEEPA